MTFATASIVRYGAAGLFGAVVFGLAGLLTDVTLAVPVSWRFLLANAAMAFAPGFAVLWVARAWRSDALSNFALAFVLSLSANLLLNVLLMLTGTSLVQLLVPYMVAVVAILGATMWLRRREDTAELQHVTWLGVVLVAAVVLLLYQMYRVGPPNVGSEELIIINRLATNAHVHYDNVSFQLGMPATYLLVPHQQLIASVALMARIEPALTQALFWTVTAAVGIAALAALARATAASDAAIAMVVGLMVTIGLFEPEALTFLFGFGFPFPNRYGIAPGILLPLILLFFWQQLRSSSIAGVSLLVLVFLILEMTFVHAREAIIALSCIVVIGGLAGDRHRYRAVLAMTGATILFSVVALEAYRQLTLAFAIDLSEYVDGTRTVLGETLAGFREGKSMLELLWSPPPDKIAVGPNSIIVPTYDDVVARLWDVSSTGRYTSRLLFPIAFLTLPLAMWWARTKLQLAFGAVVAIWGLVLHSGVLVLFVSYVVGNPEVLGVTNLIGLMLFCCFAGLLVTAAARLAPAMAAHPRRWAAVALTIVIGFSLLPLWQFDPLQALASGLAAALQPPVPVVLHVLTLAAVPFGAGWVGRAAAPGPSASPGHRLVLAMMILTVAVAAPVAVRAWSQGHDLFRRPTVIGRVMGVSALDYALLRDSERIVCSLPFQLIEHLRHGVRPGQNVIAQDSFCVGALTPQFIVINSRSGHALEPSAIMNLAFMRQFPETAGRDPRAPDLPMYTLAAFDTPERWQRLVDAMQVDLVVVEPSEGPSWQQLLASYAPDDPARPDSVWEGMGYRVVATKRAPPGR